MGIQAQIIRIIYRIFILELVLICVFSVHNTLGQKAQIEQDDQQWIQYINITRLPPNWILQSNASYRWRDFYSRNFQYHISTALGYQFTENMRFMSGIAYFKPIKNSSNLKHEIRTIQEIFFNHSLGKTGLINRFQVEERFLKRIDPEQSEPMYFRFRYALFFNIPVIEFPKPDKDIELLFTVRNELFLNGSNNPKEKFFDQERVSLGPVLSVDNWRFFLLWHNQISTLTAANNYRYTSIFVIQVLQILDFLNSEEKFEGRQNYGS